MMKRYRYYRAGFLVGLLSCNILFSFVTTKKGYFSCPGSSIGRIKTTWNALPIFHKAVYLTGLFVVLGSVGTIFGYYYFAPNDSGDQFIVSNETHHPGPTGWVGAAGGMTATPGQLANPNINPRKIDLILNATTNNPADGFHSTMSVVPWYTTSTTNKPTKWMVKKAMVLDDEVLKDILEHRFSKESMQYWFSQGLFVDAQDQKGKTLLMHAYEAVTSSKARPNLNDLMKIIAFFIEHKANLNLQDCDGNTILMYAAQKFDFTMISTVIGEGAAPSIPNKKGDTPKSFLEKNRSNKPKGYSKEEMDFLIEKAFEPPKEKGE